MTYPLAAPGTPTPVPRPASTVVVARDGADGLEVLLLERSSSSSFLASAAVFPGGVVEATDAAPELARHCGAFGDEEASARLGLSSGGLAWYVAAARETFEEAGVLLARDRTGREVTFRPGDPDGLGRARRSLNDGTSTFTELCATAGLTLAVGDFGYLSHWLTPKGAPKRFDTRFFVAAMPEGQEPVSDQSETVAQRFYRPVDALALGAARQLAIVPPTRVTLETVAAYADVASLLAAMSVVRDVPLIEPVVIPGSEPIAVLMPGDAGYEELLATGRE